MLGVLLDISLWPVEDIVFSKLRYSKKRGPDETPDLVFHKWRLFAEEQCDVLQYEGVEMAGGWHRNVILQNQGGNTAPPWQCDSAKQNLPEALLVKN